MVKRLSRHGDLLNRSMDDAIAATKLSCGHASARPIYGTSGGDYLRCIVCGLEVCASDSDIANSFTSAQEGYYGDDSVYFSPLAQAIGTRAARFRLRLVRRHVKHGHLLEVGPGMGEFLHLASSSGFDCDAVEASTTLAESIRPAMVGTLYVGIFESLPIGAGAYDVYSSFHVIEHVPDPGEHLRKAAEVVRRGGIAAIATPNAGSWQHQMLGRLSPNYSLAHLRLFTAESLRASLVRAGWDVLELRTTDAAEHWVRVLTALLRAARRQRAQASPSHAEAGSFLRKTPTPLGLSMLMLFRFATAPLRALQARIGKGNELIVIARRA